MRLKAPGKAPTPRNLTPLIPLSFVRRGGDSEGGVRAGGLCIGRTTLQCRVWGGLFLLLSLGGRAMGQGAAPAMDAQTGIVHSQRLESGVPLGGIGTGTFELMTDGAVSRATINNNWSHPTGDLPACFAAVWTRSGDLAAAHVLSLHNAYGLPAVSHLDYAGLTPQAVLTFPGDDLPVTVSLQAFSPLVPFDIRNASFPAAAFVVTIKNPAPVPVECSVALSWENSLGVGGTPQGAFSDHTGDTVTPLPATEGFFGLKFTGPPLASEEQRMRDNATGEMTLLAYPPRREAIMTTGGCGGRAADAQAPRCGRPPIRHSLVHAPSLHASRPGPGPLLPDPFQRLRPGGARAAAGLAHSADPHAGMADATAVLGPAPLAGPAA